MFPDAGELTVELPVAASHAAFLNSSIDEASSGVSTNGPDFDASLKKGEDWAITRILPVTAPSDDELKLRLG